MNIVILLAAGFTLGWICSDIRRDFVWHRDYERRHPE